jgi:hypothetical protein
MRRAVAVAAVIATAEGMRVRKRREGGGIVGGEERKLDDDDEAREYSMGWDGMALVMQMCGEAAVGAGAHAIELASALPPSKARCQTALQTMRS